MWAVAEDYRVRIGGNTFIKTGTLIVAHGSPLLTLKRHEDNGYLGIYFEIFNEHGQKLASVKRNQIYPGSVSAAYRIDGTADRVTFSERATGLALCDIRKRDSAGYELDVSARLYTSRGVLVDATPDGTNLGGTVKITGCTFSNNRCAINIQ